MFATLASGYPRPSLAAGSEGERTAEGRAEPGPDDAAQDALVRDVLVDQISAGLGILTDGGVRWRDPWAPLIAGLHGLTPGRTVDSFEPGIRVTQPVVDGDIRWHRPIHRSAWQAAAASSDLLVKQVVPGPYTVAQVAETGQRSEDDVALALAESLNAELHDLIDAGCRVITIDESAAIGIDSNAQRALFVECERRLLSEIDPATTHLSLMICGGSAAEAGPDTVFAAPYDSYLFDLIRGPGNWQLVVRAPQGRGVICGAMDAASEALDDIETLVHAMAYAATAMDRGTTRVGIAPNGSLANLSRDSARTKIERLAQAVIVAQAGPILDVAAALVPTPSATRRFPAVRFLTASYRDACRALGLDPMSLPAPVA